MKIRDLRLPVIITLPLHMNQVKLWKRQKLKKVAYFVLHLHDMTDKVSSCDGKSIIIIFFISSGVFLEREREEDTSSGVFLERE